MKYQEKLEQYIPEGLIREFRYIRDQIYENEEYNHHLFLGQRQYYNYQQFLRESNNSSIKDNQYLEQRLQDIKELLEANGYQYQPQN